MAVRRDTTNTMAGTAAASPPKTVSREALIAFLEKAGIDPNKTVSLHMDPTRITADHFDGSRTIVEIR